MEGIGAESSRDAESSSQKDEGGQKETIEEEYLLPAVQLSAKSISDFVENGVSESTIDIEQRLQELLRSIGEETLHLREVLIEENKLMNEVCLSIRQIMQKLNVSFGIPPQNIRLKNKVSKVILNKDGRLLLAYEKGNGRSDFLAEYPPRVVIAVLWIVVPRLVEVVAIYRKKVSERISLFRRLKNELKTIAKAVVGSKEVAAGSV